MTLTELDQALKNHFPVIHDYKNTASPGEYLYSYVSAIIKRRSSSGEDIYSAEVTNATTNSTAIVNPSDLRYATAAEFSNYNKHRKVKVRENDPLASLEP